jgi:hypothetical protein
MAMNAQIEQAAVVTIQPLGFVAVMSAAKLLIAVAAHLMFTPSPALSHRRWPRRRFCTNVPEKLSGLPAWRRGVSSWIGAAEGQSRERSVCWR